MLQWLSMPNISKNIGAMRDDTVFDDINGVKVADPYRRLEDGKDPAVIEWINAQNTKTDEFLKGATYDVMAEDLIKNFNFSGYSCPSLFAGRYFYEERAPKQDQSVLYYKDGLDGKPIVIFDPNTKIDGQIVTLDYWTPSKDGKYIVYGVSYGGTEMAEIHIKDLDSGRELDGVIKNCRYSKIAWLPDRSGFYYTRNPRRGEVPDDDLHLHTKVFFHKIGTDGERDPMIFGDGRTKDDMIRLNISPDGKYLAIHVERNWSQNSIFVYDTETKATGELESFSNVRMGMKFISDKVLLFTNYKANNNRVLWNTYQNIFEPIDTWNVLIDEIKDVLSNIKITKSKILAIYLVDVCSVVKIFDHSGKEIGLIPLPEYSVVNELVSKRDEEEFFYSVTALNFSKISYRFDPSTGEYVEYRRIENPIDKDDFVIKREWYESKDGTRVSMFIVHKKDLKQDSNNPTVMYGYGGLRTKVLPEFFRQYTTWLKLGGVFAITNIRGGGEYGSSWHEDGIKDKKQNSFDDFIAGGEHLIKAGYTSKQKLGILGGSNGGLLVSAVALLRPDLFKAVCSRVPLTDMARFHKFGIAKRWIHQYGNPEVKEDLERILKWSPYHNVRAGVHYPDFLFTTAENDTRVDPFHARKMTAILQDVEDDNQVLLYTEMGTGHGMRPISKIVEGQSLVLTFFAKSLGLNVI